VHGHVTVSTSDSWLSGRSSTFCHSSFMYRLHAGCSHRYASVTKLYSYILVNALWYSAAGKVTAGLAESNDIVLTGSY